MVTGTPKQNNKVHAKNTTQTPQDPTSYFPYPNENQELEDELYAVNAAQNQTSEFLNMFLVPVPAGTRTKQTMSALNGGGYCDFKASYSIRSKTYPHNG
jgi:hypothetical protein